VAREDRGATAGLTRAVRHWKTVYNRFHRWAKTGRWEALFKALRLNVDEPGSLADGPSRAHALDR